MNIDMTECPNISGAASVVEWFGYWPSFHDAEVLSICLKRLELSEIRIHTWHKTSQVAEQGRLVCTKHAFVTFTFRDFPAEDSGNLCCFNHQNVLTGLTVSQTADGFELRLNGAFGVGGVVRCRELSVRLEPDRPQDMDLPLRPWQYIAPHRIRSDEFRCAAPACTTSAELESLNLQRFARVLEFQGCIAFLGSGASCGKRYPEWKKLLPEPRDVPEAELPNEYRRLKALVEAGKIGPLEGLQMAQAMLEKRDILLRAISRKFEAASNNPSNGPTPQDVLMSFPISRFITTNYDKELEIALALRTYLSESPKHRSFTQDDLGQLGIFAVALAPQGRNRIFHCHGSFQTCFDTPAPQGRRRTTEQDRIVLTDDDYNFWYLSNDRIPYTFQRSLEVLLHSNPLFFIGYTLNDPDLLRLLRELSQRRGPDGFASNAFVLLHVEEHADLVTRTEQVRTGINVLPYNYKHSGLSQTLQQLHEQQRALRRLWRVQPCCRADAYALGGQLDVTGLSSRTDPTQDPVLSDLARHLGNEINGVNTTNTIVAVVGPPGSAKFVKVCQYLTSETQNEHIVVNSHTNEDLFSYLNRLIETYESKTGEKVKGESLQARIEGVLNATNNKPLLIVLSSIDLFLDIDQSITPKQDQPEVEENTKLSGDAEAWVPRNTAARALMFCLTKWAGATPHPLSRNRVLLTARVLPAQLTPLCHAIDLAEHYRNSSVLSATQLGLETQLDAYQQLAWHLRDQHSALLIAAAYINCHAFNDTDDVQRSNRVQRLCDALVSHVSERGTRVVRHVIRELDRARHLHGDSERLLKRLACFNTPVPESIVDECRKVPDKEGNVPSQDWEWKTLIRLKLLDEIVSLNRNQEKLYVVPSVVKRYCRTILAGARYSERRACGVHGLLSRGPFNYPGTDETAKDLFVYLSNRAYEQIRAVWTAGQSSDIHNKSEAQLLTRAALDVLRSNFACNSVPEWGTYREYIDMCTMCLDNLKNLALALGAVWSPAEGSSNRKHPNGIASAEEILFLYNELGLAYYHEGSVQDALSVWGLAIEWQRALNGDQSEQSIMYAASLNSHIAMAYLQMGRLDAAKESIRVAHHAAVANKNDDLKLRLRGLLARIDHFRGMTCSRGSTRRMAGLRVGEPNNECRWA